MGQFVQHLNVPPPLPDRALEFYIMNLNIVDTSYMCNLNISSADRVRYSWLGQEGDASSARRQAAVRGHHLDGGRGRRWRRRRRRRCPRPHHCRGHRRLQTEPGGSGASRTGK